MKPTRNRGSQDGPVQIGFVLYDGLAPTSGGYRYDRRLRAELIDRGITVEVIPLSQRSYPRHLLDNLKPEVARRLTRPYDILLQDELCHPSLALLNDMVDLPVVSIVHHLRSDEPRSNVMNAIYGAVEGRYLRSVDGVICNGATTRRRVSRHAAPPSVIAPPAADHLAPPDPVADSTIRERAASDPFRVCFLGNVIPRKGLDTLLKGVARVDGWGGEGGPAEARTGWTLTVIGDTTVNPTYARRCRSLSTSLGIRGRVNFTGQLSDGAVAEQLNDAHVLAGPSRYEGFGMVYLEAMAHGTVPLASTAGGAVDFIEDGKTGILVPPDDPAAVATRLNELATDRGRLGRLGIAARNRFSAHPDWTETARRVDEFLQKIRDKR